MYSITDEIENRGIQKGMEQGEERLSQLNLKLLADKRYADLQRAAEDKKYRHRLFKKYGL